jgi:hypothetical protein
VECFRETRVFSVVGVFVSVGVDSFEVFLREERVGECF